MKTKVRFYKEESGVLAVFTELREGVGTYSCYSYIGQHSIAATKYFTKLPLATPEEYLPLMLELMRQPYNYELDVFNVMTAEQLAYLTFKKHRVFEHGVRLDADALRNRKEVKQYYIVQIKMGKFRLREYHVKPLNVAGS